MSASVSGGDGSLTVVSAPTAATILNTEFPRLRSVVETAYRLHGAGQTVNPTCPALRLPDRPDVRFSALPAFVGGEAPVSGMKWLASYPANVARGGLRASAVLLLNDQLTGRPFACLEASHISAARTAASAVLAAYELNGRQRSVGCLGICGTGFVARYIHRFLRADGWDPRSLVVFDPDRDRARGFARERADEGVSHARVCSSTDEVVRSSDLVVFATTAVNPHVGTASFHRNAPLVLHISLRDLDPEVMVASQNFVDDVEHAFRDQTSLGLARAKYPTEDLVAGTLYDLLDGAVTADPSRMRVFSPFGLGMLDVAVGRFVYDCAVQAGAVLAIPDFSPGADATGVEAALGGAIR